MTGFSTFPAGRRAAGLLRPISVVIFSLKTRSSLSISGCASARLFPHRSPYLIYRVPARWYSRQATLAVTSSRSGVRTRVSIAFCARPVDGIQKSNNARRQVLPFPPRSRNGVSLLYVMKRRASSVQRLTMLLCCSSGRSSTTVFGFSDC